MIFFICQIISLLTLSLSLLAGCIAMASAPNLEADYPADGQLRSQVWNLAGWLEPAPKSASARELAAVLTAARPTSGFVRSADAEGGGAVSASAGQGASEKGTAGKSSAGMGLAVSMAFADELSSWPEALAVRCSAGAWGLAAAAGRTVTVLDARPFGGDNIVVIDGADGRPDSGASGDAGAAEDAAPDGQDLAASLQRCLSELNYYLAAGPVGRSVDWRLLEPGLWRAEVGVFFGPRLGPKEVTLIKASPNHFRFAPYHEAEKDVWKDQPGDARLWARRLPEARVVVNGAQYYPDRSHMGTLRRRGKKLGGREHAVWKGFLVQEPSLPSAAPQLLLDAELTDPARRKQDDYGTVVQSYMVLDSLGRVRVKKSDRLASRAAVGLDREGQLVVVFVRGAIALADLAALLEHFGLDSAMGLDGGLEAQLAIRTDGQIEFLAGRYANNFLGTFQVDDFSPSLPSVIALERLASEETSGESSP